MPTFNWTVQAPSLDKMLSKYEALEPDDKLGYDSSIYDSREEYEQALEDFYERNCGTWDEED